MKIISRIKKNVNMKNYNTFKIDFTAKYFCSPKNKKELKKVLSFSKKNNLKIFILGNGSNVLFKEKYFDGIIICLKKINKIKIKKKNKKNIFVFAECGTNLFQLNITLAEKNISGLEWSYGIPATIGGAVKMNAGAFGKCFGDFVKEIIVLENNKFKKIKNIVKYYENFKEEN